MNYEITENIEISAYEAMLTFDENVRQYANNENFNITIYDLYSNTSKTITRSEFPDYGITDIGGDIADRAKNSFYEHGGLLMYFDSENKFYIKQLLSCKDPINEETGYHSSKITLYFDEDKSVEFNTILLPKIVRSPYLVQVESSAPDPVLPEPNKRQEFDYDVPVDPAKLNRITTDYNAGDPDGIYVNTYNADPTQNVPCYYSTLSAFTDTTFNTGDPVILGSVSSYLYDETTNESYPITVTSADSSASVRIPFADNYYTELVYYEYKQYLSADDDKLHKNKLVFDMNINGQPAPEVLENLIISITTNPASTVLDKDNPTGTMHVTIYNPNINFRSEEWKPVVTITPGYTTTEQIYSEDDGTLTFDINDINFGNVQEKEVDNNNFLLETIPIEISASLTVPHQPCTATTTTTWKYKKCQISPVTIEILTFEPSDPAGVLVNDQTGTLVYKVYNPNTEFNITGEESDTKYEMASSGNWESNSPEHQVIASNTITVTYTGITVNDTAQLIFSTYVVGSNDDWNAAAIAEKTRASASPVNYRHNSIILQPLVVNFSIYVPDGDENDIHWITNDRDDSDYPPVGSVIAEVYNPNEDYRDLEHIIIERTKDPRNSDISYNFSQYTSRGIVQILYNNIALNREENDTWAELGAYLNYSDIQGYPQEQVKTDTYGSGTSQHWQYKVILPDIHPYEYLAGYSLYSLSNLTLDGGKIGSKDLACKNLTIKNGAEVVSNIAVASGCSVTVEGANNVIHGTLSAEALTAYNPATFEQPIYIEKSIYLDNNNVSLAYTGENCNINLINGSTINNRATWVNPSYPDLPPISAEEFTPGSEIIEVNGSHTFGVDGDRTSGYYERLKALNNANITFYPGKYFFDDITIGENVQFNIKNGVSTESDDKSVMIYTNAFGAGNNFHAIQDSEGPFDFRIYYGGTATATFDTLGSSMAGTIIAPSGTIKFNNYFTWVGHVWAQEVILANHASIDNNV